MVYTTFILPEGNLMQYTVKELSRLAGVSVRALHHYDATGLLHPESHTESGYRLYGPKELARLQQILFFKELDFPLEAIRGLLDSPGFDEVKALEQHKVMLLKRKERLEKLLETVEQTIYAIKGVNSMQDREWFESFDMSEIDAHKAKYADEVNEKYKSWQQRDKTKRYGKKEWAEVMLKGSRIQLDLAALIDQGKDPADADVQAVIDRHFHFIDDCFYDCSLEIYEGLSSLYVDDHRFTENIDKVKKGLADFQSSAMKVYCNNKKPR
jgi:DNA-binding transcriptional MerR regulator